jgi:hypothetical protein
MILAHCRKWAVHHDLYALTHFIAHLLEGGFTAEAAGAIRSGLFEKRQSKIASTQDLDDTRNLTLALVAANDRAAILELAQTANLSQRDGVAAGLQAAPLADHEFVDSVVGALLKLG